MTHCSEGHSLHQESRLTVRYSTAYEINVDFVISALQNGGEMYFSDMYADRPVPPELSKNKILWGKLAIL